MRYALMAILALGVVGGYGSALARASHWRGQHGCHSGGSWEASRWGHGRFAEPRVEVEAPRAAVAPPQTVVVQSPAPAPAPAPQVFVIMGGAQPAAPQTIVVPSAAPAAPQTIVVPSVTPAPALPATP